MIKRHQNLAFITIFPYIRPTLPHHVHHSIPNSLPAFCYTKKKVHVLSINPKWANMLSSFQRKPTGRVGFERPQSSKPHPYLLGRGGTVWPFVAPGVFMNGWGSGRSLRTMLLHWRTDFHMGGVMVMIVVAVVVLGRAVYSPPLGLGTESGERSCWQRAGVTLCMWVSEGRLLELLIQELLNTWRFVRITYTGGQQDLIFWFSFVITVFLFF